MSRAKLLMHSLRGHPIRYNDKDFEHDECKLASNNSYIFLHSCFSDDCVASRDGESEFIRKDKTSQTTC